LNRQNVAGLIRIGVGCQEANETCGKDFKIMA
jgi:hypothetical protein